MYSIYLDPIHDDEDALLNIASERNKTIQSLRTHGRTPVSYKQQLKWVESIPSSARYFFIRKNETDEDIGYCGLDKIDPVNLTAEISLLIYEKHRSIGNGEEAVDLLLQEAFENLHINTVFAEVYETTSARKFWEKCGLKIEGVLRHRKYWCGKYYDSVLLSITRREWERSL